MAKMQKVTPDEVGGAFHAILEDYTDGVMEQIEAELPKLGRKVNQEIKKHITFKASAQSKYLRSLGIEVIKGSRLYKSVVWRAKSPQSSLTHLLENGHQLPQGERSKAYPHIIYGQKMVEEELPELVEKAVKDNA